MLLDDLGFNKMSIIEYAILWNVRSKVQLFKVIRNLETVFLPRNILFLFPPFVRRLAQEKKDDDFYFIPNK